MERLGANVVIEERGKVRRLALSARFIAACIVAIVALGQGLGVTSPAFGRFAQSDAAGVSASFYDSLCGNDAHSANKAPAEKHHGCSHCCILCGGRDCVAPLIHEGSPLGPTFLNAEASAQIDWRSVETMGRRLIGWASSWSSRAPPFVS